MSESDDNLAGALRENGAFDPAKAGELKTKAVGTFEARMRKVERYLFVYMCVCCWLIVFAGFQFFHSTTTKGMLMNGLLVLAFLETTILMKLWYWIMNNKITVLKELKQLQLGGLADDDAAVASPRTERLHGPVKGLSRRERTVWWAALVGGSALVGAVKNLDVPFMPSSLTSRTYVTLAADGSGSAETEMSLICEGFSPLKSFSFHAPESATLRFVDSHGRELPYSTSLQDDHVRYDVSLMDPVPGGQRFSYTRLEKCPQAATEEEGVWTYSNDYTYGFTSSDLTATVVLPEGAEIVSTTPWPVARLTLDSRPVVRFEAKRGRNERFKYTVRYRLTPKAEGDDG